MVLSWQTNSLRHLWCKIGTQFQRFCSLKKKTDFLSDPLTRKTTIFFFASSVFPLSVNFPFFFPQPEGTQEWREGEERDRKREVVSWQASEEMCFSHVHIKCTWKTTACQRIEWDTLQATAVKQWQTYTYMEFLDLMYKDNTLKISSFTKEHPLRCLPVFKQSVLSSDMEFALIYLNT